MNSDDDDDDDDLLVGDPHEILDLDVGGQMIRVRRCVLTQVPGSMLAAKFSGRWDGADKDRSTGAFFIDYPYEVFKPLVDLLSARFYIPGCEGVRLTLDDFDGNLRQFRTFLRLLSHYGLVEAVYGPLDAWMYKVLICYTGNGMNSPSIVCRYNPKINNLIGNNKHFGGGFEFTLDTNDSFVVVQSFKVELVQKMGQEETINNPEIGWKSVPTNCPSESTTMALPNGKSSRKIGFKAHGFDLTGKAWVAERQHGHIHLIVTRADGSMDNLEIQGTSVNDREKWLPYFLGSSVYLLSEVQLCIVHLTD